MNLNSHRILAILLLISFISIPETFAQYINQTYKSYVEIYCELAQDHMKRYQIPASITLAQGLLESGGGKGKLARDGNNHFGIKCHDWKGDKTYHDDDLQNECFRKYNHPKESYEDHSVFLKTKPRYGFLFELNVRDYKSWARGLQTAGYATDKAYANKLIKLIEDYRLYEYDEIKGLKIKLPVFGPNYKYHEVFKSFGLIYTIARAGDTFENIAKEFDFKVKHLLKYNEVPETFPLSEGDIVYFEKKNKKADKQYKLHQVQIGESMHNISQLYGIRLHNLYKMNDKDEEYVPVEGDVLKLR